MEETPFPDIKISCHDVLESLDDRSECPNCHKSRKYYCYTCYVPVKDLENKIPKVKLPVKIDIIKHPSEIDGKSTAIHAGVLAKEDVNIYTYPCIPDYPDTEKVVLVFPSEDSVTLQELAGMTDDTYIKNTQTTNIVENENGVKNLDKQCSNRTDCFECKDENLDKNIYENWTVKRKLTDEGNDLPRSETCENMAKRRKIEPPFDRVIFIDSTWNQTKRIYSDERLKGFKKVELKSRKTKFWRHQRDNPETHLSTIEAIYYFVRDFHDLFLLDTYNGEYDDLLYFFTFMYKKIRHIYDGGKTLKAYQQRPEKNKKEKSKAENTS